MPPEPRRSRVPRARSPIISLGRDRVKERHPDEMIRRGRFGLTAPPSPARAGLRSGAGIPLAGSFPVRLGLVHVVGYLPRDVRCTAGQDDDAHRHDSRRDSSGG